MTAKDQANASLAKRAQDERTLAECYKRTFASADGKRVLADLRAMFPHDAIRFPSAASFKQPLAALMGGLHFDGSATVTKHILEQIEIANAKPEPPPTIETA